MRYFRLGHINKIFVKAGDKVKKSDKIATNGNANGNWLAHCHQDGFYEYSDPFFYNIGWSKEDTEKTFFDTTPYSKIVMPSFNHYGYTHLEWANYGTASVPKISWHPGVDLNGEGAGNADFDEPLHSPCNGIVDFIGFRKDWGNILIIKEEEMKNHEVKEILKVAKDILGVDAGDRINSNEDKEIAKAIKELSEEKQEKIIYVEKSLTMEIERVYPQFTGDSESSHKKAAGKLHECISERELLEKEKEVWVKTEAKLKEDHRLEITNILLENKTVLDREIGKINDRTQTIVDNLNNAHNKEIKKIKEDCAHLTGEASTTEEKPTPVKNMTIKEVLRKLLALIGIEIK